MFWCEVYLHREQPACVDYAFCVADEPGSSMVAMSMLSTDSLACTRDKPGGFWLLLFGALCAVENGFLIDKQ